MKKTIFIYTLLKLSLRKTCQKDFKLNQYISKYLKEFSLHNILNYIMKG